MSTISLQTSRTRHVDGPPRILKFDFPKPFAQPMFLGLLTLIENPDLAVIDGVIVQGSGPNNGGTCNLQVPTSIFGPIWDFAPAGSKPVVTLTFNAGDFSVTSVSVASPLAVVNAPP